MTEIVSVLQILEYHPVLYRSLLGADITQPFILHMNKLSIERASDFPKVTQRLAAELGQEPRPPADLSCILVWSGDPGFSWHQPSVPLGTSQCLSPTPDLCPTLFPLLPRSAFALHCQHVRIFPELEPLSLGMSSETWGRGGGPSNISEGEVFASVLQISCAPRKSRS